MNLACARGSELVGVPNNLPCHPTSFVGRERELAAIKELFDATRLLTLTGPGGCGKTRLALQAAASLAPAFPDGIWLVDLSALKDPVLVIQTVAATLGLREEPDQPLVLTLQRWLDGQRTLLLLDNCEHLVAPCADLAAQLLSGNLQLRVLATSREKLGIPLETSCEVPPLACPNASTTPTAAELRDCEAVRLFVERAVSAAPNFQLQEENATAVADICRRLDGIPLAIELAAARLNMLAPGQIAAMLDDALRILSGSGRGTLARHQTLRAAIEWSYNLLSSEEQHLFCRLSVFRGSFSLEAVEVICTHLEGERRSLFDLLGQLVDKSLVRVLSSGRESRYCLLQILRQFAEPMLRHTEEAVAVRNAHLQWYLGLADQARRGLVGPEQAWWLEYLEQEHENFRAAISWAMSAEQREQAVRLVQRLSYFWLVRGHITEGRERLKAALDIWQEETELRAALLYSLGNVARVQGDYPAARLLYDEALAIARHVGKGVSPALSALASVLLDQGEYDDASRCGKESLELSVRQGDRYGIATSLCFLGVSAIHRGDHSAAGEDYEQSLQIFRELGETKQIALLLDNLGYRAQLLGDVLHAHSLHAESLTLWEQLGDKWGKAITLHHLGCLALLERKVQQAASHYRDSLSLRKELGDRRGIANSLEGIALVAAERGDREQAVTMIAVARGIRRSIGVPAPPGGRSQMEACEKKLRVALGSRSYAQLDDRARSLAVEEAVQLALTVCGAAEASTGGQELGDELGLTPREREVIPWLIPGLSDKEIASELGIAVRTATKHVEHIREKLGVSSRAAVVGWAVFKGFKPAVRKRKTEGAW